MNKQETLLNIKDFQKLELKVATITEVAPMKNSSKLYKIKVSIGNLEDRQTVAALAPYYRIDELLRKKVVFLTNLQPARLAGEISEGMLLAAESNGKVSLLTLEKDLPDGAIIH